MIHKQLSAKPNIHYGTNINFEKTHVLLQLGDGMDQVRVRLTPEEVDQVIADLQKRKDELEFDLDKILNVPFLFWACPEHQGRVKWEKIDGKDIATCLECGKQSQ